MAKRFPIKPAHPERTCWGCDKYCPSTSLSCGNGSERTQHPFELFGDDWMDWGPGRSASSGTEPSPLANSTEPTASGQRPSGRTAGIRST